MPTYVNQQVAIGGTLTTGVTSQTAIFPGNVLAGSLIVVFIDWGDATSSINTITDTRGNTYHQGKILQAQAQTAAIYYATDTPAGANTITVTWAGAGVDFPDVVGMEFSGFGATTQAIDQTNSGSGTTATPSSGSITPTTAASVVVAGLVITGSRGTFAPTPATWSDDQPTLNSNDFAFNLPVTAVAHSYGATGATGNWVSVIASFIDSTTTTINATVAMAGKAVSGLTLTPRVTKDATFFCAAGAHATFTCNLGAFGHAILQGKATSSSFTGQSTQLKGLRGAGKATGTFTPFVTRSSTVAIAGKATSSRFNPFSNPTIINATAHLFGFAANNVVINQFLGRATLTLRASIPLDQVSINGRAILTPNPQITKLATSAMAGKGKITASASVSGAGIISGTLIINGKAAFAVTARVNKGAQVVIEAGNPIFIPVEGKVAAMGHARMTLTPLVTKGPQILIQGRAALVPNPTLGGTNNIFAGVHFAGRATGTFSVPPTALSPIVRITGRATFSPVPKVIASLTATVAIAGRATPQFSAFTQGSAFSNGVARIAGRAVFTPNAFKLVQPTLRVSSVASLQMFPGGTLRGIVAIHGFARFTPQVAKQVIQWSSGAALQYKVWQYNSESMFRVLGSSWTATSVGLTFQSVALEVKQTEAGWGS